MIEIPAWAWLEELSHPQGKKLTLGQVPDAEWDRLREMGFDLVWLMGIWQRSPQARLEFRSDANRFSEYDRALPGWKLEDIVGSPYAVQDYRPDPRIGDWRQIDGVRRKLRARGMGLILDFVPNHTAPDHGWVQSHPEYYVEGGESDFRSNPQMFYLREEKDGTPRVLAHGRDPYSPPWFDSAQLNHFHAGARGALIEVIGKLARHADGLRCDMAMLPLNEIFARTWQGIVSDPAPATEFWQEAIAAAPQLVWLAEVYWDREAQLQQLGFQFTYDKRFYDFLRDGSAGELRRHLSGDAAMQDRMARFLENHDEQRAAAVFGPERIQAAATLAATAPGLRFYYHGQIDGRKIHQPIEMSRAAGEPRDEFLQDLYGRLLRLSHEEVFHSGRWKLLEAAWAGDHTHNSLIVYQWRSDSAWKLVAANPTGGAVQGRVALDASPAATYTLYDQLNEAEYSRSGQEMAAGLYIRLEPGRAHLFDIHLSS
ncbi:MAG TPA: alpha-amylase family glycosyl hydrolase [Candidatus Dormibacteraeota bacterium]|nr:alpha-amylase family glycosyl hydrolase [Candidatus Dormibacteraeota bacterium]